jgi:hypothetical protein
MALGTQVAEALASAGLPDVPFIQYMKAIGINNSNMLLSYCLTREEIDALVVRPLIQGFKTQTSTLKAEEDDAKTRLFTASLRVIWYEASRQRATEEAEINKNSQPPQPSQAAPNNAAASAANTSNSPKSLPRSVWTTQIKKWEDKQGTSGRRFPQEQILGAESILARLRHEHNETKQYTALHLGELLPAQSFTVTGDVNNLATKTKDANLKIVGGDLVQAEQPVLDPKSTWVIMDGLAAIKWAYIFCDYGTDEDVECYIDFFNKLARKFPSSPEAVKNCWTASSWRIAMSMRAGRSFKVATSEVMADQHWVNQRLSASHAREDRPYRSKGSGKGSAMSPIKGSSKKPSRGKILKDRFEKATPPCTWFQTNQCNRAKCRFPHKCDICGDEGHGSANCWHNKWQKQKKWGKNH